MEAVLPAMAKGVQAICGQLTADAIAERAVERREHGLRFAECEWKKWQCAGRCHLAECRPRHKEFESTRAPIGEHFWVGPEPALGKHLEAKFAAGLPIDRLGHLGGPPSGRAAGRLVQTQPILLCVGHRSAPYPLGRPSTRSSIMLRWISLRNSTGSGLSAKSMSGLLTRDQDCGG